jgi:signal peptidase I
MTRPEHLDAIYDVAHECLAAGAFRIRINGNCMLPALGHGDEAIVRAARVLLPGDIIVFRTDRSLVAHRVLGWVPSRRGARILTRGDHCASHDGLVAPDRVLGRLDARVGSGDRLRSFAAFLVAILVRLSGKR